MMNIFLLKNRNNENGIFCIWIIIYLKCLLKKMFYYSIYFLLSCFDVLLWWDDIFICSFVSSKQLNSFLFVIMFHFILKKFCINMNTFFSIFLFQNWSIIAFIISYILKYELMDILLIEIQYIHFFVLTNWIWFGYGFILVIIS